MIERLFERAENVPIFSEQERAFLEGVFLDQPYIVDPAVESAMSETANRLQERYGEQFWFVTLVGGQANGSYVLRKLQKKNIGSDIDLYVGGVDAAESTLRDISKYLRSGLKDTRLTLDGVLGGESLDRYLNLSDIGAHIANEDFDLLSLPFQCAFGRVEEARTKVLEYIRTQANAEEIWENIRLAHEQSLSLHNGQWSLEFNQAIADRYQDKKAKKHSLPRLQDMR